MLGNIGPMQLLIIFLIVLLIFGTKKLRNVGGDLGSAIRDFRKGMSSDDENSETRDGADKDSDRKDPKKDSFKASQPSESADESEKPNDKSKT